MTVAELIERLQALDPTLPVMVESGYCEDVSIAEGVITDETYIYEQDGLVEVVRLV